MKKNLRDNSGVTMIAIVLTIVVIIIISAIAFGTSRDLINRSAEAKVKAIALEEDDKVRTLLRKAIVDEEYKKGIELEDDTLVVIGSGDVEYGTGCYLIPGGTDEDIAIIANKVGEEVERYENFTASYVVNYDEDKYERITEINFK